MKTKSTSTPWLILAKPNPAASLRLFCFPYAGGSPLIFADWPADLPPDVSPIQIGTTGRFADAAFTVTGRIVYEYGAGTWNEWHLLFADGSSGWLSDAQLDYAVYRQIAKHQSAREAWLLRHTRPVPKRKKARWPQGHRASRVI